MDSVDVGLVVLSMFALTIVFGGGGLHIRRRKRDRQPNPED
jgi:hypothetical protein